MMTPLIPEARFPKIHKRSLANFKCFSYIRKLLHIYLQIEIQAEILVFSAYNTQCFQTDVMNDSSLRALCSAVTLQSNKNGFFQQVANNITASVDDHWLRDFGTLKTNKLRVIKCLTDKKVRNYTQICVIITNNTGQECNNYFAFNEI